MCSIVMVEICVILVNFICRVAEEEINFAGKSLQDLKRKAIMSGVIHRQDTSGLGIFLIV